MDTFNNNSLKSQLYWACKGAFPFTFTRNDMKRIANEGNYEHSNAERQLRHLVEDGIVKDIKNEKKVNVAWIFVPPVNKSSISTKIDIENDKQSAMF